MDCERRALYDNPPKADGLASKLVNFDQNLREQTKKVRTYTIVHESSTLRGRGATTNGHEATRMGSGMGTLTADKHKMNADKKTGSHAKAQRG